MRTQTNAVNILERTSSYLRAGLLRQTPAWYEVVAFVPPSKRFERSPKLVNPSTLESRAMLNPLRAELNAETGFFETKNTKSSRKVTRSLYRAPKLKFTEDKLRQLFYEQHPWELSRPKMLVENTGTENYDWSHIQQLGKPLDGESVVQRTLFLLQIKQHASLLDAYDQARFEFYRLRMQQEIQDQVAQEEAEMFGSVFGPSAIEFGLEKEQKVIQTWKKRAIQQSELISARTSNPSESWTTPQRKADGAEESDEINEEITL
ncbi:LAMI_0E03840g1_1 [Lachancea mirantina]|uniref:37S ribosomal protein S25, mitochondrial n=1 Tax=Lachancea mirantina TaxID=1230905 RepID=A0A1G4JK77_9SACH|nr:LAMI_0E03840g1_1 [Lachancea mirantina]